jgi:thiol-disulfide isomerase/thioredoxin
MKFLRLSLFAMIITFAATSVFAQPMRDGIAEQNYGPKVGKPAPKVDIAEWMSKAPQGDPMKGKLVFLEFWATWCGPCRQVIPHLNKLVEKFQSNKMIFISVTNEEKSVVDKFLAKTPIKSNVGLDNKNITSKNYSVTSIPNAFLIDKKGIIVWMGHPANLTEELIAGFIKTGKVTTEN